ncbi:YcaO-like family protein [Marinomonas sp. KJ51-3]|uniref:YcaO-like family protein n=1 Tax=Marinomonas rhodophyticola TaxID=2992803 RepID=A0ABT3KGS5_9GAMM|nr:YcaO-like family protein [Marinomonas sp. KJ51-3]MCW4629739.1 YcaO-like family protein [Marinomonas sp. KJ51-3]
MASGNTREEATSHALCELIERDAMTLWSLLPKHQQAKQKVDLSSITDATIQALIKQIEDADVMVSVWNVTSDLNIPTFFAPLLIDKKASIALFTLCLALALILINMWP